jgi:hypothetical protein
MDHLRPTLPKLVRSGQAGLKTKKKQTNDLTGVERYHIAIFDRLTALTSVVTRLGQLRRILRNFPRGLMKGRDSVSRYEWLTMQYSGHLLALVSAYDIGLVLVNDLMRLGLPAQRCSRETVGENRLVKATKIGAALKRLNAVGSKHAAVRNLFLNQGESARPEERLDSDDLRWLPAYELLEVGGAPSARPQYTWSVFRSERRRLLIEMAKDAEALDAAVVGLFDSLENEYERKEKLVAAGLI